jgi:hypothetical protein
LILALTFLFASSILEGFTNLMDASVRLSPHWIPNHHDERNLPRIPNRRVAALGSELGDSKGGRVQVTRLEAEQRNEVARKAVLARWAKHKKKQPD